MDKLKNILQMALGNTFAMYFKAHSYHWNVEGPNFSQYHSFFGDIYEDLFDATDALAEELRAMDEYAPISIADIGTMKTIKDDSEKPANALTMIKNLEDANDRVIESLARLFDAATNAKQDGLANLAADRLDKHKKTGWMLRSHLKG